MSLGPVHAFVDRFGLGDGTYFPRDVAATSVMRPGPSGFKPPNGLGLVIDAQAVVGGGYLRFDPQKEEYSGMLELQIAERIAVKGIGLLTTRLPDGGKGYSLWSSFPRKALRRFPGLWLFLDRHRRAAGDQPHVRRRGAARRAQEPHAGQRAVSARPDPQRAADPQQSEQSLPAGRGHHCSGRWCRSPGARRR